MNNLSSNKTLTYIESLTWTNWFIWF